MMDGLTFKEKDKIIKEVYSHYKKAQLDYLYFTQHYNFYPQSNVFQVKENSANYQGDRVFLSQLIKKQALERVIHKIDEIHKHLTPESYRFIEKEYINSYDHLWWIHYYSKASYYRAKHKVVEEYMEYLLIVFDQRELERMMLI